MNVSEAAARILKPFGIGVAHRPESTIRQQIMKLKEPLPVTEQSAVAYSIPCRDCTVRCVGETGRRLGTGSHEHQLAINREDKLPLVFDHVKQKKHTFAFEKARVISRVNDKMARLLLESLVLLFSACNAANVVEMQCSESECIQYLPKEKEILAKLKLPFEVTVCSCSEPKVRENVEFTLPWKINIPTTGLVSLPVVSYVPFVVSNVDVQSLDGVRLHPANKATQLESSCEDVCYHTEKVTADVTFFGKVDFVGQRQVLFVAKNATRFMLVKLNSTGNKVSACNCIGVISVLLLIKSVV
ncbi:unnamed protein product [Dibothriocephalus latus]|uniref:Uncharacterized protein n=1 Tax=Dibothriocephalus latus TaxID=60516 RepID=A0A3P6UUN1_DIBLA|nr:unnamed protein product [Dibothriocephalus latus]